MEIVIDGFYRKTALLHLLAITEAGDYLVQNDGHPEDQWTIPKETFESTYELAVPQQGVALDPSYATEAGTEKDLGITEVRGAQANISDLVVYGDGDTFALLCKASSQSQGWMKSTKVCNVPTGCVMQVTTQQKNPDGSYAVAEALTFIPGAGIDTESEPRRLVHNR